jgi:hypothetical protein
LFCSSAKALAERPLERLKLGPSEELTLRAEHLKGRKPQRHALKASGAQCSHLAHLSVDVDELGGEAPNHLKLVERGE